jgi:hypothetical protein
MAQIPELSAAPSHVFFFEDSPGFFNRTMNEHDRHLYVQTSGIVSDLTLTDNYFIYGHSPVNRNIPLLTDWDNEISSIRVFGHVTVYEHPTYNNFGARAGFAVTLSTGFYDSDDLARLGIKDDAISSYILW